MNQPVIEELDKYVDLKPILEPIFTFWYDKENYFFYVQLVFVGIFYGPEFVQRKCTECFGK